MTTVVTVVAGCGPDKEVRITVTEDNDIVEEAVLQDGEETIKYAYDTREVQVKEVAKSG